MQIYVSFKQKIQREQIIKSIKTFETSTHTHTAKSRENR